jgi:hypothetical protein
VGTSCVISRALSAWPSERFPPGYVTFWRHELRFYPAGSVADAINALRMKSDPFAPTIDAVRAILDDWGVVPSQPARKRVDSWIDTRNARARSEMQACEQANLRDNALCATLSEERYRELAAIVVSELDEMIRPMYQREGKDLRRVQMIRSKVAQMVREAGVFEETIKR